MLLTRTSQEAKNWMSRLGRENGGRDLQIKFVPWAVFASCFLNLFSAHPNEPPRISRRTQEQILTCMIVLLKKQSPPQKLEAPFR